MGIQINGQTDTISAVDGSITVATDLTVPGALTYDDVTNIDSVGLVTARNGLHVTGGNLGIGTDNPTKLLELFGTDPTIKLMDSSGDAYALIEGDSADQGSIRFRADPLGAGSGTHIRFDTDGTERLRIDQTGKTTARSTHSNGAVNEGLRLTTLGTYSYSNSSNAGPAISFGQFHGDYPTWTTGQIAGIRKGNNWDGALVFYTNSGSSQTDISEKLRITSDGKVRLPDNGNLAFGADDDMLMRHSGNDAVIENTVGHIYITNYTNDEDIYLRTDDGSGGIANYVECDGSSGKVKLYHYGTKKFETDSYGVNIHEGTDKVVRFTGLIGEIGNVTGFQGSNTAGDALTDLGMRGTTLRFATGNAERLRIASTGQVLIGNYNNHSAIHGNLEVNGNDGINISNSYRTGSNGVQWRLIPHNGGGSTTNLRLYEGTGATEVLNITKTGLIGINLTDPGTRLEVSGGQNQTANQFTDLLRVSANANNDSIDAEVQLNFGISPSHTATANRRSRIQSTTHAGTARALAINPDGGNVGVGVDNPSVCLDVRKATAGTIARFYDTGSNGGALYNGAPIMGLSRVSNGNVSLDGLFFQIGWDKNNSNSYNIDETVFAVGNKGVGIRIDNPSEDFHMKGVVRRDNTSTSIKFHEFSFELPTGTTTTIATVTGPSASSMAIAKFEYVGLYDYSGSDFYSGVEMASLRRSNSNSAYTYLQNSQIHAGGNNSSYQPNMFWQNGSNNTSDLMITTGNYVVIMGTIRITTFNLGFSRVISV